jgi:hypothetical protein
MSKQDKKHFNNLMRNMAQLNSPKIDALRTYLFKDSSSATRKLQESEIIDFVVRAANGESISEDIFADLRQFNS